MNTDRLKFRVWDSKSKCYLNTADLYIDSNGALCVQMLFRGKNEMLHDVSSSYNIVEQCTGLKDANGKLIYEGDILCSQDGRKYVVEFYDDGARFSASILPISEWKVFGVIYACWIKDFEVRVIGNIHQNIDLLK